MPNPEKISKNIPLEAQKNLQARTIQNRKLANQTKYCCRQKPNIFNKHETFDDLNTAPAPLRKETGLYPG